MEAASSGSFPETLTPDRVAIRDLLWACPTCRAISSIQAARRHEQCTGCGTRFRRGMGATIIATRTDGVVEAKPAALFEDLLPPLDQIPVAGGRLGPRPAQIRIARKAVPIRDRGEFLGLAERFGPRIIANVSLNDEALAIGVPEAPMVWPLEAITAVQPSSSTLQVHSRIHPLVSIRFLIDSVRLWEAVLQQKIRARYRAAGRGTVITFHPRIRCA